MLNFDLEKYPRSRNKDNLEICEQVLIHVDEKKKSGLDLDEIDVRAFIVALKVCLEKACQSFYSSKDITGLCTKLRDAGRRSAPWKPTSSVVPGRPQDGSDGNRISRWLLEETHKFYATEIVATLVEAKYYLQLFSMLNAPNFPINNMENRFQWLVEHPIKSGTYKDPIQLIDIDFSEIIIERRNIQSGHLHPLDRGGKHIPDNTFLMLARSNQLQGNLTAAELIDLMKFIVQQHELNAQRNDELESLIREQTI